MRSIYLRLFIGFATVLVLASALLWNAYTTAARPRFGDLVQALQQAQADEAANAAQRGGAAVAAAYLERLVTATGMPHYLTDAAGRDVLSGEDRSPLIGARRDGQGVISAPFRDGDRVIFAVPSSDGAYVLISIAPPPYTLGDLLPAFAVIAAIVALLFWVLAADVARPLRRLAASMQQFGRGNLGARAPVARRDEIGQLAAAFNEMANRIGQLVTTERRLLQDVSHELRSPLARLNLAIELSRSAPDRGQAADRMQREASRLSELVSTLLEVVRIEGDPDSAAMAPVSLQNLLDASADRIRTDAEQRGIRFEVNGDPLGTIEGNEELLRRAFDNILGNATRYAPARTTVRVHCTSTPTERLIDVRDSGPGVRDDQVAKLGEAFYRTDESRAADTGGLGLGLAIARRAIHMHHGSLEITNAHPGLRATIHLPADRTEPLRAPHHRSSAATVEPHTVQT